MKPMWETVAMVTVEEVEGRSYRIGRKQVGFVERI